MDKAKFLSQIFPYVIAGIALFIPLILIYIFKVKNKNVVIITVCFLIVIWIIYGFAQLVLIPEIP